jgi:glycerate kinase
VARAIADGLRRGSPGVEVELVPISDGGDGFLEAMVLATGAAVEKVLVRGPIHAPVAAAFGLLPAGGGVLAIIESAQAAGMALLKPAELEPLVASTGGVGEVLREARQRGAGSFLVGIGGTASSDGGTGMARALGYRFLDAAGTELPEGGGALARLDRIDAGGFDPSWLLHPITVACDVDNPLTGERGAAAVFAPQKGAGPAEVATIESGLRRLAEVIRRDLAVDVEGLPGAGAGGGLAAGLVAFLGARLEPGTNPVFAAVGLERRLAGADAMITGEGRLDGQSLQGKAPVAAGRLARSIGVRSVALVGRLGPGWEATLGDAFDEVHAVAPDGMSAPEAMARAGELLEEAAALLA